MVDTKFKVGDRVRISFYSPQSPYHNKEGVIVNICSEGLHEVDINKSYKPKFWAKRLELISREKKGLAAFLEKHNL